MCTILQLCHQMCVVPARRSDANLIWVASSLICFTLQKTSIYLTQLPSHSALTSPSYTGNSNFTSSLSKGISCLCLWECFLAEYFDLVLEEEDDDGEAGGEGGFLGGSSCSSLLSVWKIPLGKVSFVPSNPHTRPLPSQT
jgi:hypothetical protein